MQEERGNLTPTSFNFVATEALFCLGVGCMLTSDRVILLQADFFGRILSVLRRVVGTVPTKLAHKPDQLSLCILLRHGYNSLYIYKTILSIVTRFLPYD